MSDVYTPGKGGSRTAKRKGLRGLVVHLSPADLEALHLAARAAGIGRRDGGVKEFVRRAALGAAAVYQKKPTPLDMGSSPP